MALLGAHLIAHPCKSCSTSPFKGRIPDSLPPPHTFTAHGTAAFVIPSGICIWILCAAALPLRLHRNPTPAHLRRTSAMAARRTSQFPRRPNSRDQDKEEIWKPMLDNISSGKRLPEKSLLVLGMPMRRPHRGEC